MAKAQEQAKAAAEVPQAPTTTLPEEGAGEQLSIVTVQGADVGAGVAPEGDQSKKAATVARTLDKDQLYGEVYGAAGIAYEQDGLYFDRAGNQVMEAEA